MAEGDGSGEGADGGGPWVAAGASLLGALGGYLGRSKGVDNSYWNQLAWQEQQKDRAMQYEFAQNGVSWRVQDAVKAGLHPLAALGVNPASASSTSAAFQSNVPGESYGQYANQAGQDLSRALMATKSHYERRINEQAVRRGDLENALLETNLANAQHELRSKTGPPMASWQVLRNADGSTSNVPSEQWAIPNSNSMSARAEWFLNNKLMLESNNKTNGYKITPRADRPWRWGEK